MISLKDWTNSELKSLRSEIDKELSRREGGFSLDKQPWYDKIEPGTDDLYQSGEAERLVDANSKREEV